jgi:hypothetical protein
MTRRRGQARRIRFLTVDFTTAPDPAECAAAGVIPCPYTGSARPSQRWFDDCRALGIAPLWMIQETISTRSQEGFDAGVEDCRFAESRARERGHTGPIAVVVSDHDGADAWDSSAYARGWASVATQPFFPYGALGVTGSFLAGAAGSPLLIPGEWVPETWGHGRIASQLVGAQAALSTAHDLNHVFVDFQEDDMFSDDDRALLREVRNALRGPNGGGDGGDVQTQVGQLWATVVGTPDGTIQSLAGIIADLIAAHEGESVGRTPQQDAALQAAKDALDKLNVAFPQPSRAARSRGG